MSEIIKPNSYNEIGNSFLDIAQKEHIKYNKSGDIESAKLAITAYKHALQTAVVQIASADAEVRLDGFKDIKFLK